MEPDNAHLLAFTSCEILSPRAWAGPTDLLPINEMQKKWCLQKDWLLSWVALLQVILRKGNCHVGNFPKERCTWKRTMSLANAQWDLGTANCLTRELRGRPSPVKLGDETTALVHTWWQPCEWPSARGMQLSCAWISESQKLETVCLLL